MLDLKFPKPSIQIVRKPSAYELSSTVKSLKFSLAKIKCYTIEVIIVGRIFMHFPCYLSFFLLVKGLTSWNRKVIGATVIWNSVMQTQYLDGELHMSKRTFSLQQYSLANIYVVILGETLLLNYNYPYYGMVIYTYWYPHDSNLSVTALPIFESDNIVTFYKHALV